MPLRRWYSNHEPGQGDLPVPQGYERRYCRCCGKRCFFIQRSEGGDKGLQGMRKMQKESEKIHEKAS